MLDRTKHLPAGEPEEELTPAFREFLGAWVERFYTDREFREFVCFIYDVDQSWAVYRQRRRRWLRMFLMALASLIGTQCLAHWLQSGYGWNTDWIYLVIYPAYFLATHYINRSQRYNGIPPAGELQQQRRARACLERELAQ